jgi:hypothetical protein
MMPTHPGRTLESEIPAEFVEWAAYSTQKGKRVAETLEEAICTLRFGNLAFLADAVSAWHHHADQGYDQTEPPGRTRARIQTHFIKAQPVEVLSEVSGAICTRITDVGINFAQGGMDLKATKDTLLYRYIERTLEPSALAEIPYTQPPYEANASNPAAERIIKEITTDREHVDILKSFEPSTSSSEAFALLLYTIFCELWNGEAPECHINTNAATASKISLCIFTETFGNSDFTMGIFDPIAGKFFVVDGLYPVPSLIYHLILMCDETQLRSVVEAQADSARYAASRYLNAS